jgi:hypothetical protein
MSIGGCGLGLALRHLKNREGVAKKRPNLLGRFGRISMTTLDDCSRRTGEHGLGHADPGALAVTASSATTMCPLISATVNPLKRSGVSLSRNGLPVVFVATPRPSEMGAGAGGVPDESSAGGRGLDAHPDSTSAFCGRSLSREVSSQCCRWMVPCNPEAPICAHPLRAVAAGLP